MVPAITPVPPYVFKAILEKDGFSIKMDTEINWTLFKADSACPVIVLPKKGELVSVTIMMEILNQIKMDDGKYCSLLEQVKE